MDNEKKLEVLFTLNRYEELVPNEGQVVICPVKNDWNDFGYKTKCNFKVCLAGNFKPLEGELLFGFLPSNLSEKYGKDEELSLSDFLQSVREPKEIDDPPQFFTMLPDLQHYRQLVKAFSKKQVDLILRSVNDLVYWKSKTASWFAEAIESEVFRLGFMRYSESYFAYHNAEAVLAGNELANGGTMSEELLLTFSLPEFKNNHELLLKYKHESLVPKRINILIGKNGVGKSQALKALVKSLTAFKIAKTSALKIQSINGHRANINRILAIATPGETANTFPSESRVSKKTYYKRLSLTRRGSQKIGECLVSLARSSEEIAGVTRWALFYNSLKQVFPEVDQLSIVTKGNYYAQPVPLHLVYKTAGELNRLTLWGDIEPNHDPVIRVGDGYYPLSSGQLTFFKFALLCCLYIENGTMVLMDEPETHLHPNLIADFIGLLDSLLEQTGSQALIATHSAYFVREVPTEQVLVFNRDDQYIRIDRPRLPTFGATVDSISQFVFQEDAEIRLSEKLYEKAKNINFNELDKEIGNEISLSALMRLKRMLRKQS